MRGAVAELVAVAVAETVAVAVAVAATLQSAVDSPQSADSSRRCPTARQAARLAVCLSSGNFPVQQQQQQCLNRSSQQRQQQQHLALKVCSLCCA